jgi:hypothetical protein
MNYGQLGIRTTRDGRSVDGVLWMNQAEQTRSDPLAALAEQWNESVGRNLQMTGFARPIGRMYEAACTHDDEGWSFSYLAATPEAAFEGLTQIATRRERGRSPWKRYAHS